MSDCFCFILPQLDFDLTKSFPYRVRGLRNVHISVDRWNGLHVDRCVLLSRIFHPPRVRGSVLQD